jgi:hypothetical protein
MNSQSSSTTMQPLAIEKKKTARTILGGSLIESIASGATIVLALIGLSGTSQIMLPIAAVTAGVAFLFEGGAITQRVTRLLAEASKNRMDRSKIDIGLTAEYLGGAAGLVLGVLSLLIVSPLIRMILLPVAVLVYGGTLMLSSGMALRLSALEIEGIVESDRFKKIANEITGSAAAVEFLLGLSSFILGIIALTGPYTMTLSLVGVLIIGVSGFVTGAAVTTRMVSFFRGEVE